MKMKYNRSDLSELLHNTHVSVEFLKGNGENRVMQCTLMSHLLPPKEEIDPEAVAKAHTTNEEILRVWDTEKSSWRSFRVDSVIDVSVIQQ
jgi:hypothetical protein